MQASNYKLILLATCSYVYAPYQVLTKCGIKGPEPSAFFGNYRLQKKMVSSCGAENFIGSSKRGIGAFSRVVIFLYTYLTCKQSSPPHMQIV